MENTEEILREVSNRFVLFPIRYNSIWQMYKKAESAFWTAEEIDLSKDMDDWEKLNENERYFIKHILAFFAGSDGIVNENLSVRFMNDVKLPEAKAFYGFQIAMENIHCVSKDTQVFTKQGYVTIGSHEGKVIEVWNGTEFSKVMVMKTSDDSDAYEIVLSNGMQLTCTPSHEWLIEGFESRVMTENLEEGMTIKDFKYPTDFDINDSLLFSNVRTHGSIAGSCDGSKSYNPIAFNCRPQHYTPINYSKKVKIEWLNGLFENSFNVLNDRDDIIMLIHENKQFLSNVQLLLTTLNVRGNLTKIDDGFYKLQFNADNAFSLIEQGVDFGSDINEAIIQLKTTGQQPTYQPITITSIRKLEHKIPTFCFEEPINHTAVFNGILTGQSETYSLLIDTYIKDTIEKNNLLNAINTIPCIAKKAEWAMKWISDKEASFAKRLVAFACVEGIFFSGAFCSIFWLKERGLMPGLCLSNEFISRDESLHTEFAILLYSMLQNKLDIDTINAIVTEAVEIEDEFINDSIPCAMLGMNRDLMSQYIKFVADRLIVQLGYEKIYNVPNPFHFMDRIALNNKTNFFEHTRLSDYAKARVGDDKEQFTFALNEDF